MELGILGPLRVVDGDRVVDPGTAKQRLLLAMLAVARGRPVSADVLIDQLWGERPPATAHGTLQGYIAHLRRALEPNRPPRAPAQVLTSAPAGYVLVVDDLDADRFSRLAAEGRERLAEGNPSAAVGRLRDALALWRGAPLDEADGAEWARAEIARLEEERLAVREDLAEARLALGEHDHLVAELAGLVADHPLRERLRGLLMRALYRAGRQADALAVYREGRELLADELGIDPSPALQQLEADILTQAPHLVPSLPPPSGPATSPAPAPGSTPAAPATDGAPPPSTTTTPGGLLPLVGRDAELAVVDAALAATRTGAGQVLLIHGEPGIGKTRLVEALRQRAGTALAVQGRCVDAEGVPPFWPWVQILGALPAGADTASLDLAGSDAVGATSARFGQALQIAQRLRDAAADRGCVVVIEDAHWADTASMDLLHLVAAELVTAPVLLVATYRDVATEASAALDTALGHLARLPGARHLALRGLDPASVRTLAAAATGHELDAHRAADLHERTAGNPFFVTELLRWTAGDADVALPAGVRDVLRLRLARLPEPAGPTLAAGAVIGRDFPLHLVETVAGIDPDAVLTAVEAAVGAGLLLEPAPGRLRFAHALVREVLLESLSAARRARVHARVYGALRARHGAHAPAAALAHHAHAAAAGGAEVPEAAALCLRAAQEALERFAYEDAEALARRGLDLADAGPVDEAVHTDLLLMCTDARARLGDLVGATETGDAAYARAVEAHDAVRLAEAALRSAGGGFGLFWSLSWSTGRDVSVERLRAASAVADRLPEELQVAVAALLGATLALRGEQAEAEVLSAGALEQARRLGGPALLRALRGRLVATWNLCGLAERRALAEELIERAGGHRTAELTGRWFRLHALLEETDVAGCEEELATFSRRASELRMVDHEMAAGWFRACLLLMQGQVAEAQELADALAEPRHGQNEAAAAILAAAAASVRGIVMWLRGEMRQMQVNAEQAVAGDGGHPGWRLITALALGETADFDRAQQLLVEAMPSAGAVDLTPIDGLATAWLQAEVAVLVGDVERSRALRDALLPIADRLVLFSPDATCHGSGELVLGSLAAVCGDLDEAVTRLRRAVEVNERVGARPYAALAQRRLAGVLAARGAPGDADAAATAASTAQALADELDLPGLAGPWPLPRVPTPARA